METTRKERLSYELEDLIFLGKGFWFGCCGFKPKAILGKFFYLTTNLYAILSFCGCNQVTSYPLDHTRQMIPLWKQVALGVVHARVLC